jgi:hypothetical protein
MFAPGEMQVIESEQAMRQDNGVLLGLGHEPWRPDFWGAGKAPIREDKEG